MAKIKRVEYGTDKVSLFAEAGQFDLVVGSIGVIASTKTRQEMCDTIFELKNDLHDILWELDRDYGTFAAFKEVETDEEEGADE